MFEFNCPKCKNKLNSNVKSCPNCGTTFMVVDTNDELSDYEKTKGKGYSIAILSLIFTIFISRILGCILAFIVLFANQGKCNSARTVAEISSILSLLIIVIGIISAMIIGI